MTETAENILPIKNNEVEHGDGDDGGEIGELSFNVEVVTNGYVLTICAGSDEVKEVYHDIEEVFNSMRACVNE